MKNTWPLILIALFLMPTTGCKKGSDDPAISFRSRNQRLVGKWNIIESNKSRVRTFLYPGTVDTATTRYAFNDSKGTVAVLMSGQPSNITAFEGSASIEFKADGTLTYTERQNASMEWIERVTDGYWTWRKTAKSKYTLEISDNQGIGLGTIFDGGILNLQRLSHNDITLEFTTSSSGSNPTTGETDKITTTTFCRLEREK